MARQTFQDLIAANKRNSAILIGGMFALLLILGAVFGAAYEQLEMGVLIAGVLALVLLFIAWANGVDTIMAVSGAQKIQKSDAPQFFNVVEEMAIAAGIPMPQVYLIDSDSPNAFATGTDPAHAAVAITTGLLEKLNREELQGVMAHEVAHIRNFDIRYTMLMAILGGAVVLLSDLFLRTTLLTGGSRRRNNREGGGAQAILMLIGILLAILAPLFAMLIRLALSRQREYLADASAVEFTRNPNGLACALEKLTKDRTPMKASQAVAPLYIVNPELKLRSGADSLFSTHPPIEQRIERLRKLQC